MWKSKPREAGTSLSTGELSGKGCEKRGHDQKLEEPSLWSRSGEGWRQGPGPLGSGHGEEEKALRESKSCRRRKMRKNIRK